LVGNDGEKTGENPFFLPDFEDPDLLLDLDLLPDLPPKQILNMINKSSLRGYSRIFE